MGGEERWRRRKEEWIDGEGREGWRRDCSLSTGLPPLPSEAGEPPYITSAGFQFLLLDTASQLWYFTLQYLKTAQVPGQAVAMEMKMLTLNVVT